MANDIEVTLKLNDELTKGMKKTNDAMGEMGDVSEEAIAKAMKLGKQMEDIGVSADEMTDDFLALNPQLKLYKELADSGAQSTKELGEEQKEVDKKSQKMAKGLGGIVKGFIGVGTAVAAGRALQQFAKDSLAAAAAAGTLPPAFKEAEKASDRLKVAAGTRLGTALEKPVDVLNRMKDSTAANLEIQNRLIDAERKGIITTQERSMFIVELNKGMRSQVDVVGELTQAEKKRNDTLKEGRELRGKTGRDPISDEMIQRRRGATREPIRVPVELFFEDLDLGIESAILTAMDQFDFAKVGGAEFVTGFNDMLSQVNAGEIGEGLGEELTDAFFVQYQQMAVELGNVSLNEAANTVMKELGIPWAEALALVKGVEETIRLIDGLKARAQIIIEINTKGGVMPGVNLAEVLGGQEQKKGRAAGGGVTSGRTVLVGERGPELFNPGVSGTISPNDQLGGGNAALEAEMSGMRADIRNMGLDIQQAVVEAVG